MTERIPEIVLNDGVKVPAIGFGTYALNGTEGAQNITKAIDVGYRLIDTAFNYENEGAVGQAVRQSSVPRKSYSLLPNCQDAITLIKKRCLLYRSLYSEPDWITMISISSTGLTLE